MSTVAELKQRAKELKVKNWWLMNKAELEACVNVSTKEANVMTGADLVAATITPDKMVAATVSIHDASNRIISEALARGDLDVPGLLVNNRKPEVKPQGEHESVEEFLARGGKITEFPTPVFPAPKPTKESCAMKSNPETQKKTPRKVSRKLDQEIHDEISAEVNSTKPRRTPKKTGTNLGKAVSDTPVGKTERKKPYGSRKQDVIAKAQHELKKAGKAPKQSNLVTLASLTEGREIEGRILRRMLRNSEIEKPGAQWEWPEGHPDIKKVQELIDKRWI